LDPDTQERMKNTFRVVALSLLALTPACSRNAPTRKANPIIKVTESPATKIDDPESARLQKQIEQIASAAKGRVGVAAVVLESQPAEGARQQRVSLNPHDHFPMLSVYKLPIGMAIMNQVDAGKIKLDQKAPVTKDDFVRRGQNSPIRDQYPNGTELTVSELLRFLIAESDGTASDVLMRLAGGAEAVQAYLKELKIDELVVANTEKEIGKDWETQYRNWSSPEAAVALLRVLAERRGLSEPSQALLLKFLTDSTPGPKRLKGLLPEGTIVAHKTGTSGTRKGITAATNDVGLITLPDGRRLAIAVFVADSAADEATREEVIAKLAKAVWETWSR
jgi:beta-lactamase class A